MIDKPEVFVEETPFNGLTKRVQKDAFDLQENINLASQKCLEDCLISLYKTIQMYSSENGYNCISTR